MLPSSNTPFQHITNRPRNIERHEPTFTELLNLPNYVFPVNYGGATFGFLGNPTPQDWIYASNGFNSTNEGALSFNSDSFNGVMFPQPTTSSQLALSQPNYMPLPGQIPASPYHQPMPATNDSMTIPSNISHPRHQQCHTQTTFIPYIPPNESDLPVAQCKERNKDLAQAQSGVHSNSLAAENTSPSSGNCFASSGTASSTARALDSALGTTSTTSTNLPSSEQTKDSPLPELHNRRSAPTVNNIETHERGTAAIIVDNEICDRRSPTAVNVDNNNEDENYDQTWASRNPKKPVIAKQQRQLRKGQNGEARKICESEQREQQMKMAEEIDTTQDRYHEELKGIATKYNRSFEAIINLVSYSSRYKKHRMPSLYLAKVSAKAEEVNKEKCVGNKVPLARIREMIQEEEEHSLHGGLTREEEEALLEHLKEKREVKVVLGVNREINGLAHRTGAHFVGFVSRSDIHDKFPPALITDSSASLSFFKHVVGISAEDMLVKFEQFFCAQSLNSNTVRSWCTKLILQGLQNITGEPSIRMNYVHYDMDIVAQHHVQLEGWPMGIKFEKLANLKNLQDLRRLRDALQTTACKWVQMSKRQINEHTAELSRCEAEGETVKKKRRQRSDTDTTKPKRKSKGKKAVITGRNVEDSGESDEGSAGEGSEDEAPPSKRQRTHKDKITYRSRSVIDEEGSDEE
ncbi:hypothetical protein EDD18DRAFT_1363327 [Armillaria luteobubalina]|uniref:Uncharacterized protein n=1 Tax=Armillaria luteobubalina TaxID=153913 RepID=A0AA39PCF9_9AGAR|nr:hypothetical protein EDD18DRAFT_1363327 [Armillaria luteobubalina]